ncbi:glycosyltransferase family 4 protein [Peribacillus sp. SCS-155]|uniref:glycosyltransferase family 4 protein n=1 Tax=Peribacillus sedimenti TaxID=3115297 RepID=UPI003906C7B5
MKIALICTEKLPSPAVRGGAIQIMIDGILPFLIQHHDVTVFSITDPNLPDRETKPSLEYVRFPRDQYEQLVCGELRKREFDLVHVCNRPKNIAMYKHAAPGSAFVLSLHNDMFSELKICREDSLEAIKHADAITAVSEYIKRCVIGRYPHAEAKVHVLYSGVDLSLFSPPWSGYGRMLREEARKAYGLRESKVILFIGRLSKTKGPDILIDSLPDVLSEHPDSVLTIVGGKWFSDNTVNEYVRSLHEKAQNYGKHVTFTGYIPQDKIPEIMAMGDLFVCSSQWHEPLARIHFEAMAAGIPIITSNRGGNPEIIKHGINGLIIQEYDRSGAYAEAINQLLSNPVKAGAMAQTGRQIVEEKHQFKHVAANLAAIYNKVLAERNSSAS